MTFPRLFTSRWQNGNLADLDCVPVGISRGVPKFRTGYKFRLMRELAPERWMFGLSENEFAQAYRAQLNSRTVTTISKRMRRISDEHGGKPLVLLCYEPADQFCHRHVLRAWLREHGAEIRELRPGDLPRREDAAQETLF